MAARKAHQWGKPDKDSNPFRTPTKDRPAPASRKNHDPNSPDNPSRSFTKEQSASDALKKKLFGGGR